MSDRTPKEIIEDLAPAYKGWKGNEKDKEKYRKEFLAAVTEELETGDLAETVVAINESDEAKAQVLAEKMYPSYRVVEGRPNPDHKDSWEFIIQEDPAYKDYTIEFDGQIWGRQIVSGSTYLDDEALKEDNFDLWSEVTEFPNEEFVMCVAYEAGANPELADEMVSSLAEKFGLGRSLKPLNSLDAEILAQLQPYLYEGKPSVKLPPPKKAEE
jgi:hypothetical protein